jgi:hypothetical protein
LIKIGFVPAPPEARPSPIFSSLLKRKQRPLLASTYLTEMLTWTSLQGGWPLALSEQWSLDGKLQITNFD